MRGVFEVPGGRQKLIMREDISELQDELNDAKEDLQQDLFEVKEKAESVEAELEPRNIIRGHPAVAVGIAAAMGFVLGGGLRSSVARALVLFGGRLIIRELVVSAVASAGRSTHEAKSFRGPRAPQRGEGRSAAGSL